MTMPIVKIEGSELELDDSICKTDKSLKEALAPYYPAVLNAEIKRPKDGKGPIEVVKRAGSKGGDSSVISALDAAPESISPVIMLAELGTQKLFDGAIDDALLKALDDEQATQKALSVLDSAAAQSADNTPTGF